MKRRLTAAIATAFITGAAIAQEKPATLAMGTEAPNFTLKAATKEGVSPKAATLMDFRGQTVVLAFFYKARTGG
jgi:thioredoxin-dependent peroxiredoxin